MNTVPVTAPANINVAKGIPNLTRTSLIAASNKLTTYQTGLTPPVNSRTPIA